MTDSPKDLDDFLSAPDSVRNNETERKKYILRKAEEAAEEERERNSKNPEPPSIEDLLGDMRRVASDPQTNPFYKDKTLSRKRYKRFGRWYISFLEKQFGQFEHAKQVAGLADDPATRTMKAARAQQSRAEHAGRYQERYMHPYKVDLSERDATGVECWVIISDTHATFLDPFTWYCFLKTIKRLQPDGVYLNGDVFEGAAISRHPKIPGWSVGLDLERNFIKEMFRQIRAIYDGDIYWGAGNHGLDRWAMHLSQVSDAIADLPEMRFDRMFGMDEFDVKLVQGGTWASPEGTEDHLPGTLLHGDYIFTHGTALGQTPSLTELRDHGYNGTSGHVHRASLIYATDERGGARSWMSTPMGCVPRAGRAYLFKKRNTGWQTGYGIMFYHPGGRVHQYPIVTSEGVAVCEGMMFENPGLPEPDPQKLWLPDFRLDD